MRSCVPVKLFYIIIFVWKHKNAVRTGGKVVLCTDKNPSSRPSFDCLHFIANCAPVNKHPRYQSISILDSPLIVTIHVYTWSYVKQFWSLILYLPTITRTLRTLLLSVMKTLGRLLLFDTTYDLQLLSFQSNNLQSGLLLYSLTTTLMYYSFIMYSNYSFDSHSMYMCTFWNCVFNQVVHQQLYNLWLAWLAVSMAFKCFSFTPL